MGFTADQSPIILHKKLDRRPNIAIGLSKSLIDEGNNLGLSGYHDSLALKNKDSSRILAPEMIHVNQDHKRRCLEKLVVRREQMTQENVEDVKCALEVEVIDDTALIEATAAVNRFKNRFRKETGGGLRDLKGESDGKRRRNKGFKQQGTGCSIKCVNEKKLKGQVVEDKGEFEKQIPGGKGRKGCRKTSDAVKFVYQKKDTKNPKLVATGVEEHQNVEDQNVIEKIVGGEIQETDVDLKVSSGNEKESTIKSVESGVEEHQDVENLDVVEKIVGGDIQETDEDVKVSIGNENESIIKLVETVTVNEKDDGLTFNPQNDAHTYNEAEDQNVNANTDVGSKKNAYTREEMEALRFMDEPGQKTKWTEVYSGFASSVAKEYNGLVVDANNRPTQRYNRAVNCGSARHGNPILSMPPVLPLCSPSNYRKFERN